MNKRILAPLFAGVAIAAGLVPTAASAAVVPGYTTYTTATTKAPASTVSPSVTSPIVLFNLRVGYFPF
jgi:hypothetical protein